MDSAVSWLRERLPARWSIEVLPPGDPGSGVPVDSRITLKGPNGTGTTIAVEEKQSVTPRTVLDLLAPRVQTARNMGAHLPLVVIAPWLSRRTQQLLTEQGIGYMDLTGNASLRVDNPPFFLEAVGAERNPAPKERGRIRLRGSKAGRLIRLLADVRPPYGVRELASAAGLVPGYVSRLLDALYREALVERSPKGQVTDVEVAGILRRWATSYDVFASNEAVELIAPSGAKALLSQLASDSNGRNRIAITGSFAATRLAPVTAPALLLAYCDSPARLGQELGLLPAEEGANVALLRPFDPVALARTTIDSGLRYASPTQVVVDCLTGSGRMPAEGEALLEWMQANEASWRRGSLEELEPEAR